MNDGPVFESKPGWGGQLSAWFTKNKFYTIPGTVIIALLIIWAAGSGLKSSDDLLATSLTPSITTTPTPVGSSITVLKGDNYTLVARRLVTSVVQIKSSIITLGQRLYAETIVASQIKKQPLTVGGTITFQDAQIDKILSDYNLLYSNQKAKWESWAKNIKF